MAGSTRRHDRLIPLTHDHHHALKEAKGLAVASAGDATERSVAASAFVDFFERDTRAHFREEEEVVFPLVVDVPEMEAPLARVMMEHVRIHAMVERLRRELGEGAVTREALGHLGNVLQDHVRYEEKVLFPLIEAAASADLDRIDLAPRRRSQ